MHDIFRICCVCNPITKYGVEKGRLNPLSYPPDKI